MENNNVQKEQKPKRVEELRNFPFNNFDELKKAVAEESVEILLDRGLALQWAQNGIYLPKKLKIQVLSLSFLPLIAIIGFIIYVLVIKSWFLLFILPIFLMGYFVFNPGSGIVLGFIRKILIGSTLLSLVWGFVNKTDWPIFYTVTLGLIWFVLSKIYRKAVNGLIDAVLEHEDLLCLLWSGRFLSLRLKDNRYWADSKTENGQSIYYDKGNL